MGIQFMVIVPQAAVIAFAAGHTQAVPSTADQTWVAIASVVGQTQAVPLATDQTWATKAFTAGHTQAAPFAADHTQAVIVLAATQTLVATFIPSQTQAVAMIVASHTLVAVALVVPHTQAVMAFVINHTQAIVALVVVMGTLDPIQAGMVRKAIAAVVVDQTNEDDRDQQAQSLTIQSLDLDKQATSMQDHSKKAVDTMAIL